MEITKQNETFNLTDTTDDGWVVNGTATNNLDSSVSVNLHINKDSDSLGYYNISIPTEGMINVNFSTLPTYYEAFVNYTQTALQLIQDYFKNSTITK